MKLKQQKARWRPGACALTIRRASPNWRWRDKPTCPKSPNFLFPHGNSGARLAATVNSKKHTFFYDLLRNALFEEKGVEWEGLGDSKAPQKISKILRNLQKSAPGWGLGPYLGNFMKNRRLWMPPHLHFEALVHTRTPFSLLRPDLQKALKDLPKAPFWAPVGPPRHQSAAFWPS